MAGGAKSLCISSALIKMDILSNFITLKVVLLGGGKRLTTLLYDFTSRTMSI